jgi:adenylate cyclase
VKGTIRISNLKREVPASPVISVLNLLLQQGVPIQTRCGGRAQCGRCLIKVLAGAESMSPRSRAESLRLAALSAAEDMRLACQSYTRGDITIEIVHSTPDRDG